VQVLVEELAAHAGRTVGWSSLGRFANARACERYLKKGPHTLITSSPRSSNAAGQYVIR
jgi:cell filamentation protein